MIDSTAALLTTIPAGDVDGRPPDTVDRIQLDASILRLLVRAGP